jgi:uncharacterized protein
MPDIDSNAPIVGACLACEGVPMSTNYDPRNTVTGGVRSEAQIDQGLRSYMLGVYNLMAMGVALTGVVAWAFGNVEALQTLLFAPSAAGGMKPTILFWVAAFSPLALVFLFGAAINRASAATVQGIFWLYAALVGVSISTIFMGYSDQSIAKVFFITAATFASLSLYGYTTKKSLAGWGTFLFMGLIGIIIASIVNIFLKSSAMGFIISIIGVLVFAGLTAYDTQKIKEMYFEGDDGETMSKKITSGALSLYMDFINMFMMLLRLFGSRD